MKKLFLLISLGLIASQLSACLAVVAGGSAGAAAGYYSNKNSKN